MKGQQSDEGPLTIGGYVGSKLRPLIDDVPNSASNAVAGRAGVLVEQQRQQRAEELVEVDKVLVIGSFLKSFFPCQNGNFEGPRVS